MTAKNKNISVIGAGFMGSAIIRGLVDRGAVEGSKIVATDLFDTALTNLRDVPGVITTTDITSAVSGADIILLAVKPQVIAQVASLIAHDVTGKLIISIAAGVTTSTLETAIGAGARVVRVMPNIAATVGASASALTKGTNATDEDMETAVAIFRAIGTASVVEEKLMDAVTGLSGSGPAFVYLFLEGMIDAGVACGLPRDISRTLALQTISGAMKLAIESGEHPGALIDRITSPGGTTIAGLALLEEAGFKGMVIRAVEEATDRSRELGSK
jgi:pyrroline-5-carboxylate reductase